MRKMEIVWKKRSYREMYRGKSTREAEDGMGCQHQREHGWEHLSIKL